MPIFGFDISALCTSKERTVDNADLTRLLTAPNALSAKPVYSGKRHFGSPFLVKSFLAHLHKTPVTPVTPENPYPLPGDTGVTGITGVSFMCRPYEAFSLSIVSSSKIMPLEPSMVFTFLKPMALKDLPTL